MTLRWLVLVCFLSGLRLFGQTAAEVVRLPEFIASVPRVANEQPAGTFAMPVSGLRYEPVVDVQARNLAEGQADVSVRGGTFENTGLQVGGINLLDPQTGHYLTEIPIAPAMLAPVRVATGIENAFAALNAGVATLDYGWRPVAGGGQVTVGGGENGLRRFSLYGAAVLDRQILGGTLAADGDVSLSESDGAIRYGDHRFSRVSGRLQWHRGGAQTDLFAGYQAKFFGWLNLYTPFGWPETEDIHTTLVAISHRVAGAGGDFWQLSAAWRRNADDYEADRTRPGVFNPYRHDTRMGTAALEAVRSFESGWRWRGRAEAMADSLESTSLVFGPFSSRTYWKAATAAERDVEIGEGRRLEVRAGGVWADDNRGGGRFSPLGELALRPAGTGPRPWRVYVQVGGASQVASYTALKSNPSAGLFRGNAALDRAISTNWEAGGSVTRGGTSLQAAVFVRADRRLTDWTFRRGVTARTANAVDIDTQGVEVVATQRWPKGWVTIGYTWLDKDADYGAAMVDASFYALNFARQRVTAAAVWRPTAQFEVRFDNEYRLQEANFLRRSSARAFLSSATVTWYPRGARGIEVAATVDNLFDSAFEEVPAVPASPRQYAGSISYRW